MENVPMNPLSSNWPFDLKQMQRRVALCAIGPTTLRRMDADRLKICVYLSNYDLSEINFDNFNHKLDELTEKLKSTGRCGFGPARKSANLFLRDCLYNYALRENYKMDAIENLMEVPLDGQVMRRIRKINPDLTLSTVIGLKKCLSDQYQSEAASFAETRGIHRVHLDLEWWNQA